MSSLTTKNLVGMMSYPSCEKKQADLKAQFSECDTPEKIYAKVIELGRGLPPFPQDQKIPENLVKGCQSQLYLHTKFQEGKLFFEVHSDALISAGLAALLLAIYNEEPPETLLNCSPKILADLQLIQHLTPSRANGLASLLSKMKAAALIHKHSS